MKNKLDSEVRRKEDYEPNPANTSQNVCSHTELLNFNWFCPHTKYWAMFVVCVSVWFRCI